MHFEWDQSKATANQRRHGVTFEDASTCFYDPNQVAFFDPEHSEEEDREILIGHSDRGRLLLVVYTLRGQAIRLISARRATRREKADYARTV
ncbi:MAG: BrnT family toxin [bacterium]|nr:BrnT family toxin [bacterium]